MFYSNSYSQKGFISQLWLGPMYHCRVQICFTGHRGKTDRRQSADFTADRTYFHLDVFTDIRRCNLLSFYPAHQRSAVWKLEENHVMSEGCWSSCNLVIDGYVFSPHCWDWLSILSQIVQHLQSFNRVVTWMLSSFPLLVPFFQEFTFVNDVGLLRILESARARLKESLTLNKIWTFYLKAYWCT